MRKIIAIIGTVLTVSGLTASFAWAATIPSGAVTVTSVRTTSNGDVRINYQGGATCNGKSGAAIQSSHLAAESSERLATAALLSGKQIEIWADDANLSANYCTVLGVELLQ